MNGEWVFSAGCVVGAVLAIALPARSGSAGHSSSRARRAGASAGRWVGLVWRRWCTDVRRSVQRGLRSSRRSAVLVAGGVAGLVCLPVAGWVAAVVVGTYAGLALRGLRRRERAREAARVRADGLDALSTLAAELRAGLPPLAIGEVVPGPRRVGDAGARKGRGLFLPATARLGRGVIVDLRAAAGPGEFAGTGLSAGTTTGAGMGAGIRTVADVGIGAGIGSVAGAGMGAGIGAAAGPGVGASPEAGAGVGGAVPAIRMGGRLGELAGAAFRLAEETGAPLADLLERIEADARAVDRAWTAGTAEAAGARATAVLLAALPLGGVALGYALGVDPLQVLLHTPIGAACACAGLLLQVVGLLWADRLTTTAGRPA
jgi:tight adherence protein B